MLTKEQINQILIDADVLKRGHFLLTSGRHADTYLQCANIFKNSKYAIQLCAELVEQFKDENINIVIGPAIGAVQMAYEVSRQLGCVNFFTERENGVMTLRRGFTLCKTDRVLVVEDVVTTGGSVKEVIDIVKASGATLVGAGLIVDRTGGKIDLGTPLKSVISMQVESFEADECPLCKAGEIELYKPGSRTVKTK